MGGERQREAHTSQSVRAPLIVLLVVYSQQNMSCKKGKKGGKGRSRQTMAQSPADPPNVFSMDALSEELSETTSGCPDSGRVDSRASQSSSHRDSPSRIPLYVANGVQPHHSPLRARTRKQDCDFHPVTSGRLVPDAILRQQQRHNLKNHMSPGREKGEPGTSKQQKSGASTPSSSRRTSSGVPDSHRTAVPFDIQTGFRYEDYMPLCQLQKALKKGEVLEVSPL